MFRTLRRTTIALLLVAAAMVTSSAADAREYASEQSPAVSTLESIAVLPPAPAAPSNGFDWADAGVGAALTVALIGAGVAILTVRRRAVTRRRSGVGIVACLVVGCGLLLANGAMASGFKACLPAKEGKPIVTPKEGVCKTGYTPTEVGEPSVLSTSEQEALKTILPYIKVEASGVGGKPTIRFSGVNVQIINGEGATATNNGEGNLVIGYDENQGKHEQTGSHDLVLGYEQTFTSYGGILAGRENTITAPFAEVLDGFANTASGEYAAIGAGDRNTASGTYGAWIGGGWHNTSSGSSSAVTGGAYNNAGGENGSISGGEGNSTSGLYDPYVGGGFANKAIGHWSSVSGGEENTASGCGSSVGGGSKNTAAGCEVKGSEEVGASAVSGGSSNIASGEDASVAGGGNNKAEGRFSSVSGGHGNRTAGLYTSVSGGEANIAEGPFSAILGTKGKTLTPLFGVWPEAP